MSAAGSAYRRSGPSNHEALDVQRTRATPARRRPSRLVVCATSANGANEAAAAVTPTIQLSPSSGGPGTTVAVVGFNFSKGSVGLTWDGSAAGMPSVQVTGQGTFKSSFVVPVAP